MSTRQERAKRQSWKYKDLPTNYDQRADKHKSVKTSHGQELLEGTLILRTYKAVTNQDSNSTWKEIRI